MLSLLLMVFAASCTAGCVFAGCEPPPLAAEASAEPPMASAASAASASSGAADHDAIVLDVMLQGMDGFETLAASGEQLGER